MPDQVDTTPADTEEEITPQDDTELQEVELEKVSGGMMRE